MQPNRREYLPQAIYVAADGRINDKGTKCWYVAAPFRFCLNPNCGVSHDFRQRSDFAKLTSLGSEGRSTATTILSLSAIRNLKAMPIHENARKLLSFTDNRQDASLQAGHFNDFIQIGFLRAALYRAVSEPGRDGIRYDELTQKVFDALNLPIKAYAINPGVRFQQKEETQRALREVLGYFLYRDLKRGWRVTAPNLEQCGLLEIQYLGLEDVCKAEDVWQNRHPALVTAKPEIRSKIANVLLDYMRRSLVINVDYLKTRYQERIQEKSSQYLISPWAMDENETVKEMEHAAVLYPRSRKQKDYQGNVFLSGRSGFGQYLRRRSTFEDYPNKLSTQETQEICRQLFEVLHIAGLVAIVFEPRDEKDVPGYQLSASSLTWVAGDGTRAYHDLIRQPSESAEGSKPNPFFIDYYKSVAGEMQGIEAREHTAQVKYDDREEREKQFREGRLSVLYCSPTMELGIDISELNVVNMRNVPPTPANYAQRSGRAGRSGQPALVFTYCSGGSPHDQYFYRHQQQMVAGQVSPPQIEIGNEDLIRSHVHAIWLAETNLNLGSTLTEVLDVSGDNPSLELLERVKDAIEAAAPKERTEKQAKIVLDSIRTELDKSDWYSDKWLKEVFTHISRNFDMTCDRWRSLYLAALEQATTQDKVIRDATRNLDEKRHAERLRAQAEAQLKLLSESKNIAQSDFYSYRYFASEGFLPGYNFPRLPLYAYIPSMRRRKRHDEFLSRSRFLAISEFGPKSVIYHEGAQYSITKVILPARRDDEVQTNSAKLCPSCGYLHPDSGNDLCERCHNQLDRPLQQLFRLENVVTRRRQRINCDEEERFRMGYEIKTAVYFTEKDGRPSYRNAIVVRRGQEVAKLTYGHAATLWRINLGWKRRQNTEQYGFLLDTESGYWTDRNPYDDNDQERKAHRIERVIPYVEDRRNCLLFEPAIDMGVDMMASLQAVLKNAIQAVYELEDAELQTESLPSREKRKQILFYEAAEGGAGVLRRLIDDSQALKHVAETALSICHFDPQTGEDVRRSQFMNEDCEAACYDCLMSYTNQLDHEILDRHSIRSYLMELASAEMNAAPSADPRAVHLEKLMRLADSELERKWLGLLEENKLRLPSKSQVLIENCHTRPDFLYEKEFTAIYVDGPHHKYPDRAKRDTIQTENMENYGYTVIRFTLENDWIKIIKEHPNIFGT